MYMHVRHSNSISRVHLTHDRAHDYNDCITTGAHQVVLVPPFSSGINLVPNDDGF